MKKIIYVLLAVCFFCGNAYAWEVKARWVYPPTQHGKNRVQIFCKDGRAPVFVENSPTQWCIVNSKSIFCRPSMEEAAKDWCRE